MNSSVFDKQSTVSQSYYMSMFVILSRGVVVVVDTPLTLLVIHLSLLVGRSSHLNVVRIRKSYYAVDLGNVLLLVVHTCINLQQLYIHLM